MTIDPSLPREQPASNDPPDQPVWMRLDSETPLPVLPASTPSAARRETNDASAEAAFWLVGDAVMCACPDCRAPMSVRLWLMIADCWRCGASIELSEEQEQQIRRLLEQSQDRAVPVAATAARVAEPERESPAQPNPTPTPMIEQRPRAVARAAQPSTTSAWVHALFRDMPAWLVSLIVHLILLTILALWPYQEEEDRTITLSATVSRDISLGGDNLIAPPQDEIKFDLPLPDNADLTSPRERKALELAAKDAEELRIDPDASAPQLPNLQEVKRRVGDTGDIRAALAARDPRIRVEMVTREGGTTLTEAAVARGLRWLAAQQKEDGSWTLRGYDGQRGVESRSAATGMALLAFLGAGQTHLSGRYQPEVSAGIRWLLEHQEASGDLRADADRQAGMYAHGQAAIALCEAFALTGDERLREPAEKALQFIAAAQYSDGGWRYTPDEPRSPPGGDTSVVGWQLMAIQSARAARLKVPDHVLELADQFLDRVESHNGARYAYRPGERATPTMTAEALLCRVYLGWGHETPGLAQGVRYLAEDYPPSDGDWNIYYWYYATQLLHHYGGEPWDQWNRQMRDILVFQQEASGKHAGSWAPRGAFADTGGRLYVTALAVCTLEVYYRHLPLFRPIELE